MDKRIKSLLTHHAHTDRVPTVQRRFPELVFPIVCGRKLHWCCQILHLQRRFRSGCRRWRAIYFFRWSILLLWRGVRRRLLCCTDQACNRLSNKVAARKALSLAGNATAPRRAPIHW